MTSQPGPVNQTPALVDEHRDSSPENRNRNNDKNPKAFSSTDISAVPNGTDDNQEKSRTNLKKLNNRKQQRKKSNGAVTKVHAADNSSTKDQVAALNVNEVISSESIAQDRDIKISTFAVTVTVTGPSASTNDSVNVKEEETPQSQKSNSGYVRRPNAYSNRGYKHTKGHSRSNFHGNRQDSQKEKTIDESSVPVPAQERDAVFSDNSARKDECERTTHSPSPSDQPPASNEFSSREQPQAIESGSDSPPPVEKVDSVQNGKQFRSSGKTLQKRKSSRGKNQKPRSSANQGLEDTPDAPASDILDLPCANHEAAAITKHDVVECSTQTDKEESNNVNVENTEATGKHVKTNAAGLALLNRLSAGVTHNNSNDNSTVEEASINLDDGANSLEVNQSATEAFELMDEMSRIDLSMEQGQVYYDDSSINAPAYEMPGVPGSNGYYQPQQQQPWMMAPVSDGSQEFFMPNQYVQQPVFMAMTPYGACEYIMPQPYPIACDSSFQNQAYGYPQMSNAPGTGNSQAPLKYEQVSIGGTIFFNPVYAEDEADIDNDAEEESKVPDVDNNNVNHINLEGRKEKGRKVKYGRKGKASRKNHHARAQSGNDTK